jgi:hypothetical protein
MFDIFFVLSILLFSILSFVEFFVFNEEALLALCFFAFIFFLFNNIGGGVFDSLNSRATKFEYDLLLLFNLEKKKIESNFLNHSSQRAFSLEFLLLSVFSQFISKFSAYSVFKFESLLFNLASNILHEFLILEKACVL